MTLLKLASILECGTIRLQSQLYLGKSTADYILTPDKVLKCWGRGENGFDFYPINIDYKIIN